MLHYVGTTAQLSIVPLVSIISPAVAVITLVLLILLTCWIKRHYKGKGTHACVHAQSY